MTNQTSDTAAALASALPTGDDLPWIAVPHRERIAAFQADRLAEQGWVLVRLDDEATVERVARALWEAIVRPTNPASFMAQEHWKFTRSWYVDHARHALAALAARPGGTDTEQAEVDRG